MCYQNVSDFSPCHFDSVRPELKAVLGDYFYQAREQVKQGNEFVFMCQGAVLLLRPEQTELVIVGFHGEHCLKTVMPHIVSTAKAIGAKTLRGHTKRKGEGRYLRLLGYSVSQQFINNEYVLRVVL